MQASPYYEGLSPMVAVVMKSMQLSRTPRQLRKDWVALITAGTHRPHHHYPHKQVEVYEMGCSPGPAPTLIRERDRQDPSRAFGSR